MSEIRILRDFYSYPEETTRTLRIYTPDAYQAHPDRRFPVLYMMDGQNVFNHPESALYHTWCANTTMDRLIFEGRLQPWIIVGIDHLPDRFAEYVPWPEPAIGADGRGRLFADFLVNHLKPFVDQTYRTLGTPQWTAVMGASLGGLMSLVLGKTHPDVFGRIGAVSPSVMWAGSEIFRLWDRPTGRWCKIYLDAGTLERYWYYDIYLDYVESVASFHRHLKDIGLGDHELRFVLAEGHFHNEEAWQARLPDILPWLLEAGSNLHFSHFS
ncbi:alpha/beta hydrolase [Syntrophobacter fumaroxidans]|uniref:Putative esterase n=1 Tax=Syntrophobacter fumaroxidans (strain DSM 10017 / MPOB) TaxID=335543 RepID=A0LKQ8_SYNFM|nr:alpha/beta hydrolase-fold protein [Syntrophobacter fumaroxidans]ABK18010.1 putative esterase [Syntrophobacter fumaroxidans MPOB]